MLQFTHNIQQSQHTQTTQLTKQAPLQLNTMSLLIKDTLNFEQYSRSEPAAARRIRYVENQAASRWDEQKACFSILFLTSEYSHYFLSTFSLFHRLVALLR